MSKGKKIEADDAKKQRIAFFLPSLAMGGVERSTVRLANDLAAKGYSIDMVLVKSTGPLLHDLSKDVRVVDLRAYRLMTSVFALAGYLSKFQPVAMISAMDEANLIAIWAKRLSRVSTRLIVSVRIALSESLRAKGGIKRLLLPRLIGPAYLRHADAIVAVSAGVADDLAALTGLPREKIEVIYNGVVSRELQIKGRETINHPWLVENAPPVILGVGRLDAAKDFTTLIEAFAELRARQPARLMILGDGPERARLEALIARLGVTEDVALPGFAANPYPYMKAARLFVLSSRREGLPGVLIEAVALGTSVVSTDCPSGPHEILEDGKWGRLVPVGDAAALTAAMREALANPGPDPSPRGAEFTIARASGRYLDLIDRIGC